MPEHPAILAIDRGGTKCHLLAVDANDGNVICNLCIRSEELPAELRPARIFAGIGRTPEMLNYCLDRLKLPAHQRRVVVYANNFANTNTQIEDFERRGITILGYNSVMEPQSILPSENLSWGVGLSAGTGFVGVTCKPDCACTYFDGDGPLLGDWGSGYFIGHQLLRQAFREYSISGKMSFELEAICEHLIKNAGASESIRNSIHEIILFKPLYENRTIMASLSQVCAECERNGSAIAHKVLLSAGQEIAEYAVDVAVSRGFADLPGCPIVMTGSIFSKIDTVSNACKAILNEKLPNARVIRSSRPQICGIVVVALKQIHPQDSDGFINNFFESYKQFAD